MAAYLGVVVVLTLPGVLTAYLFRLRLGMLQTWAAVPLFSVASVFAKRCQKVSSTTPSRESEMSSGSSSDQKRRNR